MRIAAEQARVKAALARYRAALAAFERCSALSIGIAVPGVRPAGTCVPPIPIPTDTATLATTGVPATGRLAVVLTAEDVAYIAFARLHLTPLEPVVGPPPDLNPWHMAAVGYPLWLSGGGNAHPAPVDDRVYNLFVRLDAHVTRTDFIMGDGHVVSCTGAGVPWSDAVEPGMKSPWCGYQYTRPSLPKGNYTVTARTYWDVDWVVNNERGVIRMTQTASIQLPVGEIQVLVH